MKSDSILNDDARIIYFESPDIHLVGRQEDIGGDPSPMSGHWYGHASQKPYYRRDKGAFESCGE